MSTATSTAVPERARWPRLAASPQPPLRSLLPRGYAGYTEATTPRHLVLPATTTVSLVVKLLDSAHRPPAFVMGARGSSTVLDGDCAPSYLEVRLAPLGAYALLGLPMDELSGQLVDVVDVVGADGRRLGEQLQVGLRPKTAARLVRFDGVWRRLDQRRPLDWGQVAAEVGYADQAHLIRDFRQFTGTTPTEFLAQTPPAAGDEEVAAITAA
jgi:AraC-like DNA-binding protein